MKSKSILTLSVLALLIGLLGFTLLNKSDSSPKGTEKETSRPTGYRVPTAVPIDQFRGTISSINGNVITVVSKDGKKETITITQNVALQRLVSGSIEKGDTKTEKATVSNLRTGQEVLVIIGKDKGNVSAVLIIK